MTLDKFYHLDGNIKSCLFVFFYSYIFSVLAVSLYIYLSSPALLYSFNLVTLLSHGFSSTFSYVIPIAIVITLYKKLYEAVTIILGSVAIVVGIIAFFGIIGGAEDFSSFIPFTLYLLLLSFILISFGLILRVILKIKPFFRGLFLAVPYLIIILIFGFVILKIGSVDANDCSKISDSDKKEFKAFCYESIAIKTNNLDLCMQMYSRNGKYNDGYFDQRNICIETVVSNLEKVNKFKKSDCVNFSETQSRDYCYHKNALKNNDGTLCTDSSCYYDIAIKIKNASFCGYIEGYDQENCYRAFLTIAKKTKDPSVCDNISSDKYFRWIKETCYKNAEIISD